MLTFLYFLYFLIPKQIIGLFHISHCKILGNIAFYCIILWVLNSFLFILIDWFSRTRRVWSALGAWSAVLHILPALVGHERARKRGILRLRREARSQCLGAPAGGDVHDQREPEGLGQALELELPGVGTVQSFHVGHTQERWGHFIEVFH